MLVRPVDQNPPKISTSSTDGFVDENAPVGTKVIDSKDNPLQLSVSDPDLVSFPLLHLSSNYTYRLNVLNLNICNIN